MVPQEGAVQIGADVPDEVAALGSGEAIRQVIIQD